MELTQRLRAIAAFLPEFEQPGFVAGEWILSEPKEGVMQMPYVSLAETASKFVEAAYHSGWVEFTDWVSWSETGEARDLLTSADAISKADVDQLGKLLTICIRRDRFVEGAILGGVENGLILRILRRADALLEQVEARS